MLIRLPNLSNLDIRYITKADNTIIESALDLVNSASQRKMLIKCSDTDVDPTKFVYNHMTTKKEVIDRDLYSYSLDGLTFETFQAKRIKTSGFHGDEDIWDDDVDEMYMGGDSEDSQMGGGFYNPAGNSDDEDQDDFDDFINNDENEMYNELDEY